MQHQPPAFSEVDADGDGSVSEAELTAAHQKRSGEMCGGKCECMGEGKGMQHGKHGGMTMPTFGDLDLDGNGCINAEEFAKHQGEMHK
jgi:Ca2+-binding EF-hand superfamily protein